MNLKRIILQSSQDPKKLSLTIQGFLVQVLAVLTAVLGALGYTLVGDFTGIIEFVSMIISTGLFLIGNIQMLWGLIRKVAITKK